jgi:hypothetical protein
MKLAFGKLVSEDFCRKVIGMSNALLVPDPSFLMACMAFESGETFSPSVKNAAGSGAIGLIQFMPATAQALRTSTEELAAMTAEQQLAYVSQYYAPLYGKLQSLSDVYMAILWPAAIGKPEDFVLFRKNDAAHPRRYIQNAGLDWNHDGVITKAEATRKVVVRYFKGLQTEYVRELV